MGKAGEMKLKYFDGEDYTCVTFQPDLSKFKMTILDKDIVALMSRRAYDIAGSTKDVKVFLNGQRLPVSEHLAEMVTSAFLMLFKQQGFVEAIYVITHSKWKMCLSGFSTHFSGGYELSIYRSCYKGVVCLYLCAGERIPQLCGPLSEGQSR